jgi:hypothetical protein
MIDVAIVCFVVCFGFTDGGKPPAGAGEFCAVMQQAVRDGDLTFTQREVQGLSRGKKVTLRALKKTYETRCPKPKG